MTVVPVTLAWWLAWTLLGERRWGAWGRGGEQDPGLQSGCNQMVLLAAQHVGTGQEAAYTNLLFILWLLLWTTAEHTNIKSLLYFFFFNRKLRFSLYGWKAGSFPSGRSLSSLLWFTHSSLVIYRNWLLKPINVSFF